MSEYHSDSSLPQPEIEQIAQLFIIDSDTLGDEELEHWRGVGLRFVNELGDESFRMRFGVPKPHEQDELLRYVDHFVTNTGKHHTMFLLMQNERLIGAATLFDFDNKELPNTNTVAEVSITRVDDKPGLGIATVLLKQARSYAYAAGKTHCYASFEPSNDASRKIINKVFKVKNIAAGKTSLTDRFYRLHNVNPDDYIELENAMKIYCGEEPRIEEEIVDVATKRKAKIIKLGKRATKESLRVDKKQKK